MRFFKKKNIQDEEIKLSAYLTGRTIPLEDINDGVFSEKLLGDGIAIEPDSDKLTAPADGEVILIMEMTGHACGMRLDNGLEILMHIGIDTANLMHEGFVVHVKKGEKVRKGKPLITFDREWIAKNGYRDVTVMLISNPDILKNTEFYFHQNVTAAQDTILTAQVMQKSEKSI